MPALYLRKVIHPQARDNYRVVLKDDGLKIEIGSIGNRVLGLGPRYRDPHEGIESRRTGKNRTDCMNQFRDAWPL